VLVFGRLGDIWTQLRRQRCGDGAKDRFQRSGDGQCRHRSRVTPHWRTR